MDTHVVAVQVLEHENEGTERHQSPVNFAKQLLFLICREQSPATHQVRIIAIDAFLARRGFSESLATPGIMEFVVDTTPATMTDKDPERVESKDLGRTTGTDVTSTSQSDVDGTRLKESYR